MNHRVILSFLSVLTLMLSGCVSNPMRQYDKELKETVQLVKQGSVKQAIVQVEKNNEDAISKEKDLLYYFEKGELQTLDGDYAGGKETWLKADEIIHAWEDSIKTDLAKLSGDFTSHLISDKTRRYEGQDYEKVMLSTNLTLSHIMQGSYDLARIEMKKTVEREKLIEAFRDKEYDKLKEEAEKDKVTATVKDMKGYPMAELETPEVAHLKNGFQNAFSHYLAGYFFEVTGEPSMAEPGYRNAVQLAPNSRLAQAGLREMGRRKPSAKESDVLFVIESGFAPSWKSTTVPVPVATGKSVVATPLSFPLIKAENPGFVPPSINVSGKAVAVETLTNVDAMARRQLKDQLPSILMRTVIRATVKSVVQNQAYKAGAITGLVATVATVGTEQADDRSWRTLPERISVARATLPRGTVPIEFQTGSGSFRKEVEIANRFTIIPIRITGGTVFVGQANVPGTGISVVDTPPPPAKPARKAVKKTPSKN